MTEILGEKLYTLAEVGELLGLSMNTMRNYVNSSRIKSKKIGGRRYISENFLRDFLTTPDGYKEPKPQE